MRPLDLALRYLEVFFSGERFDRLSAILADDLVFEGPYHRFATARDYVAALEADPPRDCTYRVIGRFEAGESACVVYELCKPGARAPVAQLFETRTGRISRILLVFDTAAFA